MPDAETISFLQEILGDQIIPAALIGVGYFLGSRSDTADAEFRRGLIAKLVGERRPDA